MSETPSPTAPTRAQIMRAAGDLIGSEALSRHLGVSPRKGYQLMAGTSPVHDHTLDATATAIIDLRQRCAMLLTLIRREQGR